jgi:hypothetical protein
MTYRERVDATFINWRESKSKQSPVSAGDGDREVSFCIAAAQDKTTDRSTCLADLCSNSLSARVEKGFLVSWSIDGVLPKPAQPCAVAMTSRSRDRDESGKSTCGWCSGGSGTFEMDERATPKFRVSNNFSM